MSRDSVIFGLAGVFFGILVGWIIGSQQDAAPRVASSGGRTRGHVRAVDGGAARRVARGGAGADGKSNPQDAAVRLELGNLYFDSERFADAARWYEQALAIEPRNVNASTDLGIAYYYMNQPDRALQQFDRSLAIDPRHSKTLLNVGIVRAFGKDDLRGGRAGVAAGRGVRAGLAEGKRAKQALDSLRSAHPNLPGGGGASGKPPGHSRVHDAPPPSAPA